MKDTIVSILKIVAPLSVALIVFAQALKIPMSQVTDYFKERLAVMLRGLIAVLVVVPILALAIIMILKPSPEVAVGLAILVICPPAPLMLKATPNIGKGDAAFMASLHLSLALLAFITVPLGLYLISKPLGFGADVNMGAMGWTLARTIFIPVILGLLVRALFPKFADAATSKLDLAGTIGLLVVVLFALVAFYPAVLAMDGSSYLVIAAVSVTALVTGHLLGPSEPEQKTTLAIESGVRHPVLALSIAAANFTPEKAMPVMVPAILVLIGLAMVYLIIRKKAIAAA
ncbi:MAG TPA: bile acid:sodium symporter [Pyrinomonadaceae bacterium]|nr:bile acid:sodium symporter [Pyrinomonadaceae bacterium]